ncbi:STA10 protein, partial [Psilopogon haemacephalus]|nr:STA10 protein [Psilopogon haemacephalus]
MSRPGEVVYIPDDSDFSSFRAQCESLEGWHCRYNKAGVTVWSQGQEETCTVQKIKVRRCLQLPGTTHPALPCPALLQPARGRLCVSAGKCPSPLKNRDFVTLRSWLPLDGDYIIINYSVKHPKYPPRKDFVRAVSLQTGYLVKASSAGGCVLYYLTQVDPRGECPAGGEVPCPHPSRGPWVLCLQAMRRIYKAGLKYPEWKRQHDPGYKPWVYPEQSSLPSLSLAELSLQRAASLELIDEAELPEDHLSASDHEA